MEKRTKIPSTEMSIFTEPGVPSFLLHGTKVYAWVSSDSSGELKIASTPYCSRRFLASSSSSMRRPPSSHTQVTPLVYSRETRTVRTRRTAASVIPAERAGKLTRLAAYVRWAESSPPVHFFQNHG